LGHFRYSVGPHPGLAVTFGIAQAKPWIVFNLKQPALMLLALLALSFSSTFPVDAFAAQSVEQSAAADCEDCCTGSPQDCSDMVQHCKRLCPSAILIAEGRFNPGAVLRPIGWRSIDTLPGRQDRPDPPPPRLEA
jgi:hypothetical protein